MNSTDPTLPREPARWRQTMMLGARVATWVCIFQTGALILAPGPALQLPAALLFYLICPGVLLIDWLHISEDPWATASVVVGTSLAFNSLIATLLLYLGNFSVANGFVITAGVTLFLATVPIWSPSRIVEPTPVGSR